MNNKKPHFVFNKEQRSGVFILLIVVILGQMIYFFIDTPPNTKISNVDNNKMLFYQNQIDSLFFVQEKKQFEIRPFNPNFISDYKGYVLGMSTQEIDRLHKFRSKNKFINSVSEFQKVTKIYLFLVSRNVEK